MPCWREPTSSARRWAIALLLARPLREMSEVPLEDLAREAPALCAQAIRALDSDAELEKLAAGGRGGSMWASRLNAPDAPATVYEIEALRGVIWQALLEELERPSFDRSSVRLIGDLADRLAHVCATTLAAMLTPRSETSVDESHLVPGTRHEEAPRTPPRSSHGRSPAVLVDEREDAPSQSIAVGVRAPATEPASAGAFGERPLDPSEARRRSETRGTEARPRPLPWDIPARTEGTERRPPQAQVEGRDPAEAGAAGGDPVMRVTRRPQVPVDRRD